MAALPLMYRRWLQVLDSRPFAGGSHEQAESVAASSVSVPSGLVDCAHESGGESLGSVHQYPLHYYFLRATAGY